MKIFFLILSLTFGQYAQHQDICQCEIENQAILALDRKIGYLEQKLITRESETVRLKRGPDVSTSPVTGLRYHWR